MWLHKGGLVLFAVALFLFLSAVLESLNLKPQSSVTVENNMLVKN